MSATKIELNKATPKQIIEWKRFQQQCINKEVITAYLNELGQLCIVYTTQAGYVSQRMINNCGEWIKTEYYYDIDFKTNRPHGDPFITKKNISL